MSDYTVGKITQSKLLVAAYPMLDDEGTFTGAIALSLDVDWFTSLANEMNLPPGYSLTVLDTNGVVLGRRPNPETWVGVNIKSKPLGTAVFTATEQMGTFRAMGLDRNTRFHAFTTLKNLTGGGNLIVVLGVPDAEINQVATRNRIHDVALIVGVIFAAVCICSVDLYLFLQKVRVVLKTKG